MYAKRSNTSQVQCHACSREPPATKEARKKKLKLLAAAQETTHYAKSSVFTAQLPTFTLSVQGCTCLNHSPHKKAGVSGVSVKATSYISCCARAHAAADVKET